ncbi:MAG: hypothetical protein ACYTG7_16740 [Planctomycetota bacterium]|jgi:hypothetical protein
MSRIFDYSQFRILFSQGMLLTLTGSRGAQGATEEGGSRHLLGAAYSLTLSALVAGVLFHSATAGQFLLVTMTLSMVLTATAVIQELAGGLFHPQDLAVSGHLPITAFTRFASRLSEFGCMLVILTLNLNLVPSLLMYFMTGGSVAAPFITFVSALTASIFIAAVCLVLYLALARMLSVVQLEGALLYLNILVSLAILSLLVNAGRILQSGLLLAVKEGAWSPVFPPSWFAGLALYGIGDPNAAPGAAAAAGIGFLAALLLLFLATLAPEPMLRMVGQAKKGGGRSAPGPLMRLFEKWFVREDERAAFEFTGVMLGRDKGFRMRAYPILAFPVLIITFSLFDKRDPLFFICMLHLANLYLPLVIAFLPYGDHYKAAWVFDALPLPRLGHFARGVEKAFIFRIALPLYLLNASVLAWAWAPLEAFVHAAYAMLAGLLIAGIVFRLMKAYPFTREFRGMVAQEALGGIVFLGFVLLSVLAWIQYLSRDSLLGLAVPIVIMIVLHKLRFAMLARSAAEVRP